LSTEGKKSGNPSLLRRAIDKGLSGDKAGFHDPAAAPLGTDDEAAGTPNTREQVALSLAAETEDRPTDHKANAAAKGPTDADPS
jgi:hypothetical protein